MQRKTLKRCKEEHLLRLAKWLKMDISGCKTHDDLAEAIYFNILFV
jgi:hypothetical protein